MLLDKLTSPSRKLSDLFWINQNWCELENNLGTINVCDIGCGSGNYYIKLKKYSNNKINKYKGLDIYENQTGQDSENVSIVENVTDLKMLS